MDPKTKDKTGDDKQVGLLPDLPGDGSAKPPEDFVMYPKWVEGIIVNSKEEEAAVKKRRLKRRRPQRRRRRNRS
jgi:hypothetical protein